MGASTELLANIPEQVKAALALRAQGRSWRKVASELGHSNHKDLYLEVRSWDHLVRQSEKWESVVSQALEIAQEAGAQLQESLLEGSVPTASLPVVYGIAADKVANLKRAEAALAQRAPQGDGIAAEMLARLQAQGGGSATLTVEVSAPPSIDVTPIK